MREFHTRESGRRSPCSDHNHELDFVPQTGECYDFRGFYSVAKTKKRNKKRNKKGAALAAPTIVNLTLYHERVRAWIFMAPKALPN